MKKLILCITIIWLSACSSNPENLKAKNQLFRDYIANNKITDVSKVTSFRFNGWSSLTDEFLVLASSPKRKYLIELTGFCSDVRWAHAIILNRSTDSTLHAKFDSVATVDSPQMNCRINKIYPVSPEQVIAIKNINNPPESKS